VSFRAHMNFNDEKAVLFSSRQTSHSLDVDYMLLQPPLTCLLNTP
jgi:hypothetical protein